ncbi:PPA1309 family protein [Solicola gregarius]|uniref:PPA1309 family protein n=1 Tax=Solicola gregarius TaxID=2908642 RepID=A0AA46TIQ3_9ACTN|nr:PPA1309 family protein [Solicola gregarius]UYM06084.1 PPA1309 family protein [Solicola gregarius]
MRVGEDSALRQAVLEIESHAAGEGWDQPPRLYALVPTGDLVRAEPAMARSLGLDEDADPDSLTPIAQDDVPAERPFEDTLAQIMWPPQVVGCAAVVERLMLPPEAEDGLPDDARDLETYAAKHPDRQDVRIVAAVTRTGDAHCAVRMRANPDDLLEGPDLVPALTRLIAGTLAD